MRLLLALSLFIFLPSYGQDASRTFIKALCSPKMWGRGYVNGGDSIAGEFISNEFKAIGLLPFKNSYKQHFEFPVNTFPKEMVFIANEDTLRPGIDYLVDPSSAGGTYTYKTLYFNGDELLKKERKVLKIPENTILIVRNYGFTRDSIQAIKKYLHELAADYPIIELTNDKLTWSVSQEKMEHPYLLVFQHPELAVCKEVKINITQIWESSHTAANIVGYLPAHNKSDEFLVLSAHYDHLGCMGEDTYFPGANDNASGNGMLIALAKELSTKKLKYNIVFIAFAGEEIGLLGSKYMVEHPLFPLEKIKFLVNLDIMGSGEEGITVVNASLFPKEFKKLQKINARKELLEAIKPRGPAANSDHYYFTKAGVPSIFIYTMGPNKNYHDIADQYTALSFSAYDNIKKLVLLFLYSF